MPGVRHPRVSFPQILSGPVPTRQATGQCGASRPREVRRTMSASMIDEPSPRPHVRSAVDSRPVGQSWPAPTEVDSAQPALVFDPVSFHPSGSGGRVLDPREPRTGGATRAETEPLGPPRATGHRVHVVAAGGPLPTQPGLPDVRGWSASLALAMAEAVQGRRPVGQLSRWVDERVLATLTVARRAARSDAARPGAGPDHGVRPPLLRSVRLQFPQPRVVEAAAHVQHGERSSALAFRLDVWYDRWLCTALELGPRPQP
jgi:hypothetical protein